jgi:hypothetical protein
MRFIQLLVCLIISSTVVKAQTNVDSLKSELADLPSDTSKVNLLIKISEKRYQLKC